MDPITVADVFRSDLFTATSLTDAVNEIPYVPQRLMELGIFEVKGTPTTTAWLERKGSVIELVANTPRGAPGKSVGIDRRKAIPFEAAHLQLDDQIYPDELQNVRAFGGTHLAGLQELRDERQLKMSQSVDLTLEYHRLGAIQGLVLDADGETVLVDLYDRFGISEPAEVGLELEAAWDPTDGGVIRKKIRAIKRSIRDELGGMKPTGIHAFVGDDFFDALVDHPEVRETYLRQQDAGDLREDAGEQFAYGGVLWENYRGQGAVEIADDEARLFPTGVPGLFKQLFAPADTMEAVNTLGLVKYSMVSPDPSGKNKFVNLEVQSNPITYCSRPGVLRKVVLGAAS